jgi:hypothetical protein
MEIKWKRKQSTNLELLAKHETIKLTLFLIKLIAYAITHKKIGSIMSRLSTKTGFKRNLFLS